ncbi:MAG TPA: hypothetical protein PLS22_09165 [Aquabacterium sp.]|jgi:hypothetical protein|nr:hypothetical protein [Aquabacterium sp.]
MIHHFARAFAIRENIRALPSAAPRMAPAAATAHRLRIHRDPSDARRTVITGRFADVCAALDRMVELEAA